MKYLLILIILLSFNLQAETWIVTIHNELDNTYFGCHPDNMKDGNGCIKLDSEKEADKFVEHHKKGFGKGEGWIEEIEMTQELRSRVKKTEIVELKDALISATSTKMKPLFLFKLIPDENVKSRYLIKADFTIDKKNITKEIEAIEKKAADKKKMIEKLKNSDWIDNADISDEQKEFFKLLLEQLR